MKSKPVSEEIKKYIKDNFYYDPITGNIWKKHNNYSKIVGTKTVKGCLDIYIKNNKTMKAHRVAWFLFHGYFPDEEIDHKDHNAMNNKIENLREATHQQNCFNRRKHIDNSSGYKGVTFDKTRKKWQAQICINNNHIHLGRFNTAEEAFSVYEKKAVEIFGEFNLTPDKLESVVVEKMTLAP